MDWTSSYGDSGRDPIRVGGDVLNYESEDPIVQMGGALDSQGLNKQGWGIQRSRDI